MSKVILKYAKKNYEKMLREPDGNLKYKHIVPGSMYSNSLWDWDSWLVDISLRQFVDDEDIYPYEQGCILNFFNFVQPDGRIPIVIFPDHTGPDMSEGAKESNIHKPCLAQHIAFIIKSHGGDAEWLRPYFNKLLSFVDWYINNSRHNETGLYFWLDDVGIGVDNDPCTFYRPNKSSASIFLNCFMYKELLATCFIGVMLGVDVEKYRKEAENLKNAVRKHCYDEKDGFYYSVDLNLNPINTNKEIHSGAPRHWDCLIQRIGSWSGFLAMWAGIATPRQAERMVKENLLDEKAFWAPTGVRTLSKYEKMYSIKKSSNPSCWLGPVWGISNYMVFKSLVKYGYTKEAKELANKNISLFEKDILNSGELHEYYDPESGQPIMNPGFQNWNLLSLNMQAWLDGKKVSEEF